MAKLVSKQMNNLAAFILLIVSVILSIVIVIKVVRVVVLIAVGAEMVVLLSF